MFCYSLWHVRFTLLSCLPTSKPPLGLSAPCMMDYAWLCDLGESVLEQAIQEFLSPSVCTVLSNAKCPKLDLGTITVWWKSSLGFDRCMIRLMESETLIVYALNGRRICRKQVFHNIQDTRMLALLYCLPLGPWPALLISPSHCVPSMKRGK